jgi:hypothetical protein
MNKAYDEMKQVYKTGDNPYLPGDLISENEVISIIKQLKGRKACGSDMIQNEHLIFGCPKVVKCLTIFLINVISKAYVPNEWRKGFVAPLFKGGDKPKTHSDSYRPVCLLSRLLKIFEKVRSIGYKHSN